MRKGRRRKETTTQKEARWAAGKRTTSVFPLKNGPEKNSLVSSAFLKEEEEEMARSVRQGIYEKSRRKKPYWGEVIHVVLRQQHLCTPCTAESLSLFPKIDAIFFPPRLSSSCHDGCVTLQKSICASAEPPNSGGGRWPWGEQLRLGAGPLKEGEGMARSEATWRRER